jgi:heme exporter protein A
LIQIKQSEGTRYGRSTICGIIMRRSTTFRIRGLRGHMLETSRLECVRGERRLFRDLSFTLGAGTLLEVRGPNGSGKTSLLRMLCGLLAPTAGHVAWNGSDIRRAREEFGARLAYIGHLNGIKDDLTALENLTLSARVAGIAVNTNDAHAALRDAGLDGFQHSPSRTLSQGQRRRIALARLRLSTAQTLWVLDEPFNALDVGALALMQSLLGAHLDNGGMVVLTTHQEVAIPSRSTRRIELGE